MEWSVGCTNDVSLLSRRLKKNDYIFVVAQRSFEANVKFIAIFILDFVNSIVYYAVVIVCFI